MRKYISVFDLRKKTGHIVKWVRDGGGIVHLTLNGKVVARILPATENMGAISLQGLPNLDEISKDGPITVESIFDQWLKARIYRAGPQGWPSERRLDERKMWDAVRFILSRTGRVPIPSSPEIIAMIPKMDIADKWILSRLNCAIRLSAESMRNFRFTTLAAAVYEFFWCDFIDWYLKLATRRLRINDPVAQAVVLYSLDAIVRPLRPLMPFISEAIWQKLGRRYGPLVNAPFPKALPELDAPDAEQKLGPAQIITRKVRNIRSMRAIPKGKSLLVTLKPATPQMQLALEESKRFMERLSRSVITISTDEAIPKRSITFNISDVRAFVTGAIEATDQAKDDEITPPAKEVSFLRDRLKHARDQTKLSIGQVEEKTEIPEFMLENFENGTLEPSLNHLRKLAEAYHRPVAFFIEEGPIKLDTVEMEERAIAT